MAAPVPCKNPKSVITELSIAKERVNIFKAAWTGNIDEHFFSCKTYLLCQALQPVFCDCSNRPKVEPENVDLYTCGGVLLMVVLPSLESNQTYLDLLCHSALHCGTARGSDDLTVTYADVAAAACNVNFLRLLFTSAEGTVRQFYKAYYSLQDSVTIVKLFIHALNGGSCEVLEFLTTTFEDELSSYWKLVIMEACLWLATTDEKLTQCFQHLVQKFGVNLRDGSNQFSPLRLTCFYGSSDMAEYLIENGADMYAINSDGYGIAYDAYRYGSYIGRWDVLMVLLKKGLNMEAVMATSDYVSYPLMYVFIQHDERQLVRCLVSHGHSVNLAIRFTADGQSHTITPLMLALTCRHHELTSWLLDNGADCNTRSFHSQRLEDDSWTPLLVAASQGDMSAVMSLVKHGALLDVSTARGETVIELAYDRGKNMAVVHYLLQVNVPVVSFPCSPSFCRGLEDSDSLWSLLELAVYKGDVSFTRLLLTCGHYLQPLTVCGLLATDVRLDNLQQQALECILDAQRQVLTLQASCRNALRGACGSRLVQYVFSVAMPARLKSFLLLEDVLGPYRICTDDSSSCDT